MAIEKSKLNTACLHLKVDPLNDEEYHFLREYHRVISLIATALKSVESNRYTFSLYLPMLFGLKIKLQALVDEQRVFECISLVRALLSGLESRFGNLMDPFGSDTKSVPLFIAMMTNPQFKLNFMGITKIPPELLNRLKAMLISEAGKIEIEDENSGQNESDGDDNADVHVDGNKLLLVIYHFE